MTEDKRLRQRIEFVDRVLCYKHMITSANVKPDPSPIRIQIKDISYSGLGIVCNRDLGRGDFLLFNLENNNMTKEFMLEVKWCKYANGQYEAGLQFTNLTKEMIIFLDATIKSYLKHRSKMQRSV